MNLSVRRFPQKPLPSSQPWLGDRGWKTNQLEPTGWSTTCWIIEGLFSTMSVHTQNSSILPKTDSPFWKFFTEKQSAATLLSITLFRFVLFRYFKFTFLVLPIECNNEKSIVNTFLILLKEYVFIKYLWLEKHSHH